ncbi:drug resistance transporter, EmrB/QacA subfamily [Nocardia amikacinitolerans]|nr:drug resistance transporter, EmrB/QacA subfamily [Nocardia amikacinitolerans]
MRTRTLDPAETGPSLAAPPGRGPWPAFIVVLVAAFMDLLDMTIVNVTVPTLQHDLGATYTQIEWTISGYVLGFAALLITGGRLGDIYGRRRLFLLGVVGFTAASALCGLSTSPELLIGARLLQGAMAGLMVPQVLSIVQATFPPGERQRAIGIFGGISGLAAVAGMVIGGGLIELDLFGLSWRPIFLINIPVGIAALVAGRILIPESRSESAPRLDPIGMVLAIIAVTLLVYPLIEGRRLDWPAWTFLSMGLSFAAFGLFVAFERRRTRLVGSPLVVLGLFRLRSFTAGLLVWLLFNVAMGGFFVVWTLYMQAGLGWTALHAGLVAATFAVGAGIGAGSSMEVLVPRFGRGVLLAGALINAMGFGLYAWLSAYYGADVDTGPMAAVLVFTGVGFGMMFASTMEVVLAETPAVDAGSASGLLNTGQQLGMALGVALAGVLFFTVLEDNSVRGADTAVPTLRSDLSAAGIPAPVRDDIVTGFRVCVHDRSASHDPSAVPDSCRSSATAEPIERVLTRAGETARGENFSGAFAATLGAGVATLIVVFGLVFLLPRGGRSRDEARPSPVAAAR